MIKVLFVCHGNICRSPMAEFIFKDYLKKKKMDDLFHIESCATSSEEIGNPVHYGTKRILDNLGIDCSSKRARKIKQQDFFDFDYIIAMDKNNLRWLNGYNGIEKVKLLLEYAGLNRDVRDPWYTGDFEETYEDILLGIESFFKYLKESDKL
ncbi:MAG: low molecular weight phosphotyrosine protein phosphatase [Bacilli bacterium]|nr:low molecular weight phosphotyrosine protein phosphatase [Bacilli bacterium]